MSEIRDLSEVPFGELAELSINRASLGIYWITPEGRFVYANEKVRDKLGYSLDELRGMYVWDVDPDTSEGERERIWRELKEEKVRNFESEHQTKAGEIFPVKITSHYIEIEGEEYEFAFANDISKRKERERQLKRKNRYLDHTPEFVTVIDEKGEVKYQGHTVPGSKGLDVSEVVGSSGFEFVHPGDREEVREMLSEILENPGEEYRTELRGETSDGWAWFEVRAVNYLDRSEVDGIIVTSRDITERKEVEEKLRESKRQLDTFFDDPETFIAAVDTDGTLLDVNKSALDFIGVSLSEVKGEKFWKTPWWTHSEGLQERLKEGIEKSRNGEIVRFEANHVGKDDEEITVDFSLRPVRGEDDEVFSLVASGRDITERKRIEEELRRSEREKSLILESSPNLIVYQNLDHEIIWANKRAGDSVNEEPSDLVGRKCYEIWHDRGKPCEGCPVDRVMETGKVERGEVGESDGTYVLITAAPVKDEEGNLMGIIEITLDITERREAEERKEFLTTLLRQDLASKYQTIQGYLQLLEEAELSGEHGGYLRKAIRAGREADEILGMAKELEEIENTEWSARKDIVKVLEHVIDAVSESVEEKGVEIEVNYPERISKVEGDYSLNTLFKQLLLARIRISECDRIKIDLSEGGETVLARIEDDGKPLLEDTKDLFTGRPYTGETSGVGGVRYYMLREIGNHNNAKMEVKDSEMGGAMFDIRLRKA